MLARLSPAARTSAKLTLVLWLAVLAFVAPATIFAGQVASFLDGLTLINGVISGLAIAAVLYGIFRRTRETAAPLRAVTLLVALVVCAALQATADFASQFAMQALSSDVTAPPLNVRTALLTNLIYLCIYACNIAVFWIVGSTQVARERELELANAQAQAATSELQRLRLQLDPHFMCNALNAVSGLIAARRYGDATAMTEKLADFLRASLRDHDGDIALAEEIDTVGAYLDVEATRFGDRLEVDIDMADDLQSAPVPPFILQPLVENVMKHAVAPSRSPVRLTISALREGGQLVLRVLNDGVGAPAEPRDGPGGIGLKNIRARLHMRYGAAAGLHAGPVDGGFCSIIRLPLEA